MPKVEIYFVGVCTHLRGEGRHRVVLVNAWHGDKIKELEVDPHEAWLVYGPGEWDRVPLDGVSITLNAKEADPTYDPTFDSCIERAEDYAPKPLPPVDEEALHRLQTAAALFECRGGRYYGGVIPKGPSLAKLEVVTEDLPVLTITPFPGLESQIRQVTIAFQGDAVVQIQNIGKDPRHDHDQDFVLHYRVGTDLPVKVDWPKESKESCQEIVPPYPHNSTGPGCANSTYP
jgi:hypothetical protein